MIEHQLIYPKQAICKNIVDDCFRLNWVPRERNIVLIQKDGIILSQDICVSDIMIPIKVKET